jgi:DNA recombination protein RmuC
MNILIIVLSFVLVFVFSLLIYYFLKKKTEISFASLAQTTLKEAQEQFFTLASTRFNTEQVKIDGSMDAKKQAIESTINKLNEHLSKYETLIKEFETDRVKKYTKIEEQIKYQANTIENLQKGLDKFSSILTNVKLRGQWGERMAEDILKYCGLKENLHYSKNQSFDGLQARPDYIFKLPDNHVLAMDVKFPLSNYLNYVNAEKPDLKEFHKKQFLTDVKNRIKEIERKNYMPLSEQALDFAILFIPNDQVYGFINNEWPGLVDEVMEKKIILCSPWTLYAVLKIVWQAWNNYHYAQGIKNIITIIKEFSEEFEKYKKSMVDLGVYLNKSLNEYNKLVETRARKLDIKIERIDEYSKGQDHIEIPTHTNEKN